MCSQLASWLNEKEMIEHLFGPNYHVEVTLIFIQCCTKSIAWINVYWQ